MDSLSFVQSKINRITDVCKDMESEPSALSDGNFSYCANSSLFSNSKFQTGERGLSDGEYHRQAEYLKTIH